MNDEFSIMKTVEIGSDGNKEVKFHLFAQNYGDISEIDQPDGDGVLLKITQDIQDDLSDMVELSFNDIASMMRDTGYHIHIDSDNRPKWMMMRR